MRKLSIFNFVSLNGFYKGPDEDISWHNHDEEGARFSEENLKGGDTLVFGRVTYERMQSFWTTPEAFKQLPMIAEGMNKAEKIVFSNTLSKVDWHNTTLIKGDMIEEMKKLKQSSGNDMCILGSGNVISQLADHNLIDNYQLLINPLVLTKGTPLFKDMKHMIRLKLTSTREFKNGNLLLCYKRMKE